MQVFPIDKITVDPHRTREIKSIVESTFRLITFSRSHYADDLLNSYLDQTTKLKDLVSIKNAQLEAESEEEAVLYAKLLRYSMDFISQEILRQNCFKSEIQLFQLFRLISPESHSRHPNKYRTQNVQIGRYLCPDPKEVPFRVAEVIYNMNQIANPIVRAVYLHHELIRIHPFVDGNGRTTRMAKNWLLLYELYPPIFISNGVEKQEYVETLESSFLHLDRYPGKWNDGLEQFFIQEIDRLKRSALEVYQRVSKIGYLRSGK